MARILFVNRYFYPDHSATSQMLSDLAFSLADSGLDVTVITSRQRCGDATANLPSRETIRGVVVHRVWTSRFGRDWLPGRTLDYLTFYVSAFVALLAATRAGDTIVAKTDPPLISVIAAVVALIRRARLVNWLQDIFPEAAIALGLDSVRSVTRPLQAVRNWSLRRAHQNVVLGERMAQRVRTFGIRLSRIRTISNWADARNIRPVPAAQNALRQQWQLQGNFVVGYSGNLGRAHDVETILAAMCKLRGRNDIQFLFIGNGCGYLKLQRAVSAHRLNNVRFQSFQPRQLLAASLSAPDVHLVSLLPGAEGLIVPSKLFGILAAGRSVLNIGDADGEVARILARSGAGVSVDIGDSDALAVHIERLAAAPEELARRGELARQCFDTEFSDRRALAQWRSLLTEQLALAPLPAPTPQSP